VPREAIAIGWLPLPNSAFATSATNLQPLPSRGARQRSPNENDPIFWARRKRQDDDAGSARFATRGSIGRRACPGHRCARTPRPGTRTSRTTNRAEAGCLAGCHRRLKLGPVCAKLTRLVHGPKLRVAAENRENGGDFRPPALLDTQGPGSNFGGISHGECVQRLTDRTN
jgi:hypothetical protein